MEELTAIPTFVNKVCRFHWYMPICAIFHHDSIYFFFRMRSFLEMSVETWVSLIPPLRQWITCLISTHWMSLSEKPLLVKLPLLNLPVWLNFFITWRWGIWKQLVASSSMSSTQRPRVACWQSGTCGGHWFCAPSWLCKFSSFFNLSS